MCSVLFLDIVEYSKKSVAGQISLKDRFNNYLSEAINDVPVTDRIILDTGDGAAINFLGDVEDALKAALSLRESLLNEDPDVEHPLLVRMGINLGPVRLVRDINGQPNIVGDGINVAQRVMGFADVAQILVSRSYYDAVSRLSPHYAGMFHYQGSRTDKHVREHEVYAIGYPGDKTTMRGKARADLTSPGDEDDFGAMGNAQPFWTSLIERVQSWTKNSISRFSEAEPKQRAMYVGGLIIPVLLLILLINWATTDDVPVLAEGANISHETVLASPVQPSVENKPAVEMKTEIKPSSEPQSVETVKQEEDTVAKTEAPKTEAPKIAPVERPKPKSKSREVKQNVKAPVETKPAVPVETKQVAPVPAGKPGVRVICTEGTEVFVDGVRKGSVGSRSFFVELSPGTHTVIVSHPSGGIYPQEVKIVSGTVEIRPSFCK